MMNDMAEKGDMITVGLAGYHGAVATPYSYPCGSTRATTMTKDYNLDSTCEQLLVNSSLGLVLSHHVRRPKPKLLPNLD
jgi:hypothetical protein